jgi:ketosteroid isomerase-like protein
MSRKNEQLVREGIRAFNAGDIEALVAMTDPEAEFELIGGFAEIMGRAVFKGPDGVRRLYTDWFATFKTLRLEAERFLEAGQRLVTLTKLDATVEGSDAPTQQLGAVIWSFKDEKISRIAAYYDREEALEAAGLSEQDAYADS